MNTQRWAGERVGRDDSARPALTKNSFPPQKSASALGPIPLQKRLLRKVHFNRGHPSFCARCLRFLSSSKNKHIVYSWVHVPFFPTLLLSIKQIKFSPTEPAKKAIRKIDTSPPPHLNMTGPYMDQILGVNQLPVTHTHTETHKVNRRWIDVIWK